MDGQSIQKFEWRLERELEQLHQELKDDRYQPRAVRRHWIDKGGGKKRPLGIPTVRDRVVQASLRQVLEPIFVPAQLSDRTTTGRRLSGPREIL